VRHSQRFAHKRIVSIIVTQNSLSKTVPKKTVAAIPKKLFNN